MNGDFLPAQAGTVMVMRTENGRLLRWPIVAWLTGQEFVPIVVPWGSAPVPWSLDLIDFDGGVMDDGWLIVAESDDHCTCDPPVRAEEHPVACEECDLHLRGRLHEEELRPLRRGGSPS